MLTDGEHGLLAPVDDHAALAGHVLRLLDEPDVARALTRNALATCDTFSWRHVRGRWLSHYRQVWWAYTIAPAHGVRLNAGAK
jgi:glycosyltransferase involved in cell wall biosynthesis